MPTCNNCLAEHNNYFKNGKAKKSCGNKCKKYKLHRQKTLNEFCEDHIGWFPYYKLLPYDKLWKAPKFPFIILYDDADDPFLPWKELDY